MRDKAMEQSQSGSSIFPLRVARPVFLGHKNDNRTFVFSFFFSYGVKDINLWINR